MATVEVFSLARTVRCRVTGPLLRESGCGFITFLFPLSSARSVMVVEAFRWRYLSNDGNLFFFYAA
jgi:hypothetical protein